MPVLVIERVDVGERDLDALVGVPDRRLIRTTAAPHLVERLLEVLPGIRRHRCENDERLPVCRELADTETPHLLEHVAFELMALSGSPRSLRGETRWDFAADGPGRFHVRLEFDDDLVAIAALDEGSHIVDALFGTSEMPDVGIVVARLMEVRDR